MMEWRRLRQVLDQVLEVASDSCERIAHMEHFGCLFVDEHEQPVEAGDAMIANGVAAVMPVRDFSCIPVFGEN